MYTILPIASLATQLMHRSQLFTERRKVTSLDYQQCLTLVKAIVEYDLYGRLAWAKLPSEIDDCLSQYLDWWVSGRAFSSDEGNGPVCQNYYALILDPVILKISHLLNEVMGVINDNERWRIWHMLPMGDDLLLERGEDFRIVEFERRFSSGEWRV